MFSVLLSGKAERELRKINPEISRRMSLVFQTLEAEPIPYKNFDLKKIAGRDETYRIRISNYRIVYRIYWSEKRILVMKAEKRNENTYRWCLF